MANHKRKKPKSARSGCLMCKPWKMNGFGKRHKQWEKWSDHVRRVSADIEIEKTRC